MNSPMVRATSRIGLAQAQRHAWRLAVMFIDLDEFKNINDAYVKEIESPDFDRLALGFPLGFL